MLVDGCLRNHGMLGYALTQRDERQADSQVRYELLGPVCQFHQAATRLEAARGRAHTRIKATNHGVHVAGALQSGLGARHADPPVRFTRRSTIRHCPLGLNCIPLCSIP